MKATGSKTHLSDDSDTEQLPRLVRSMFGHAVKRNRARSSQGHSTHNLFKQL